MKRKIIIVLAILAFCLLSKNIYAEDNYVDIKEWSFIMLTGRSDQDENVVVSKLYKAKNKNEQAFCIEPNESFKPMKSEYTSKANTNINVYNIAKAYEEIGKNDNNYYIAAQLLIWQETTGIEYTFDGNDYKEYKDAILNYLYPKKLMLKEGNDTYESYIGEEYTIDEDYSEYNVEGDGIEIISNTDSGLTYKIVEELPEVKTLNLEPKNKDEDQAMIYVSETSQDIYYHPSEYNNLKSLSFSIKSLKKPEYFTIKYSKKNEKGENIVGAEFSVYEIDEEDSDELVFIKTNEEINLYEILLEDYTKYEDLRFKTSERYEIYINDSGIIETNEVGYFPYEIYSNSNLIKSGKIYVLDDNDDFENGFVIYKSKLMNINYSEDKQINETQEVLSNKKYYLCESEPAKGYTYKNNPCVLVDGNEYDDETFEFINDERTYTLRLMKQSPDNILLNGAHFRITYDDNGIEKSFEFITGSLLINKENNNKYLIYKYENDDQIKVVEFQSDKYENTNVKAGRYYYYQSDSPEIDKTKLKDKYVLVVSGGYKIDNLPYSSSLTIEELQAPEGFIITEPIYHVSPDIKYSEITFKNYRVNYMDIIPKKKFKFPKTCINV